MIGLINADSLKIPLADNIVHMIATSPPYWNLRDYGLGQWEGGRADCDHTESRVLEALDKLTGFNPNGRVCDNCGATRSNPGLGLEPLHDCLGWARGENCGECYVCRMRLWAAECWRVLRDDGVMFLNLGDSYASQGGPLKYTIDSILGGPDPIADYQKSRKSPLGLKPKDLIGIPWRVALALQADGWWLRSAPPWLKKNSMPESVRDRPSTGHEFVFLLTKSKKYYFDADAIRNEHAADTFPRLRRGSGTDHKNVNGAPGQTPHSINQPRLNSEGYEGINPNGRNRRTTDFFFDNLDEYIRHLQHFRDEGGTLLDLQSGLPVAIHLSTAPYPGAHFACFPPALVEPMIKAGTSERGVCAICGSPFERVVEKGFTDHGGKTDTAYTNGSTAGRLARLRQAARENGGEYVNQSKTTGWRPTCTHDTEPVPAIVLDPFAGSGTTGQVARQLGRHFIGLDLSFDYLSNQAKSRLEIDRLEAWETGGKQGHEVDLDALPLFQSIKAEVMP